ncbi:unnamed protein product [Psylliodes chrysocephalus]|uniref:Uncharacterized protein n=1 Tax=Psylliodes chrysocephalus TaxID=3402493 RepID=A0A9P0GG47_9CUCU|nr:unnamed protein product [Psylliodes chrysocephala]
MMNKQQIKINVSSDKEYRKLTALINGNNFKWNRDENRATRSIKVMVRNLYPTTSAKYIAEELKESDFKIKEVIQKLKRTTLNNKIEYISLTLCMLVFNHTEDINKIYNMQHLKLK